MRLAFLCFSLLSVAASATADVWSAGVAAAWYSTYSTADLATRLGQTNGKPVFEGAIDGRCWLILWDVSAQELQIWRVGSRVSDLSQSLSNNVLTFDGLKDQQNNPALTGKAYLDGNDELVVEFADTSDGVYKLNIDDDGVVTAAWNCRCTTLGGEPVTGNCSQPQCDALEACGAHDEAQCNDVHIEVGACP